MYYIRTNFNGEYFYFSNFSTIENAIIWTGKLSNATNFTTEKEVEEFKAGFFQGRNCEIIRI